MEHLNPYWDPNFPLRMCQQRIMRHTRVKVNKCIAKVATQFNIDPQIISLLLPPAFCVIPSPFEVTFSLLDPTLEDHVPTANNPAHYFPMSFAPPCFKIYQWRTTETLDTNMTPWGVTKPTADNLHCNLCNSRAEDYGVTPHAKEELHENLATYIRRGPTGNLEESLTPASSSK